MPIKIGGSSIFAIHSHNFGQSDHCFMPPRLRGAHFRKQSARPGAIVALEVKVSKPHSHFNGVRRERKSAFKHRDSLVKASNFAELVCQFEKGRLKRWPPRRGLAQLIDCLVVSPGAGQYHGKQGFDLGIVAATRGTLQRSNRFNVAVLHHEGASENLRSQDIAPVRTQYTGGEAFWPVEASHFESKNRIFARLIAEG